MTTNTTPASAWPVLLSYPEAAAYLGTPEETVRGWGKRGILPLVKLGGATRSRVRIRRADLDAFIEASTIPAIWGPLSAEQG